MEVLVVLTAVLLLFGGQRLPEIARTLGRTLEELRRAAQNFRDQILNADLIADLDPPPAQTPPAAPPAAAASPEVPPPAGPPGASPTAPHPPTPPPGKDLHDRAG